MTPDCLEKLQNIFTNKYLEEKSKANKNFDYYHNWVDIMDQLKCRLFDQSEVSDILNFEDISNFIFIDDPSASCSEWSIALTAPSLPDFSWIMVPKDVAEKVLILGDLPSKKIADKKVFKSRRKK